MDDFKEDLKNIDKKRLYQSLFVLFLLITIPVGVRLAGQVQVFTPKAQTSDNIQALTNQLLEAKKDYTEVDILERIGIGADTKANLTKMTGAAAARKAALLKEAETDPKSFLDHATLADQRSDFPAPVQPLLEEKRQTLGELTVLHADDFEKKVSKFFYKLKEGENLYNVSFTGEAPEVLSGSIVEVTGISLDKEIVAGGGEPQPIPTPPPFRVHFPIQPIVEGTTGIQKTVVLLVNFDNDRSEPVSAEEIRQIMFGQTGNSAFTYYKENSFSKTYFQGDVFGWFTIPGTADCRYWDWTTQAEKAASDSGINISSYPRRVYVFPTTNCPYGGMGTIGGNPSMSWIYLPEREGVYLHELGHNLGVHHANNLFCNPQCYESEYGDPYEVMGYNIYGGNFYHFNAPHKEALHWLPPHKIQIASGSATYRIFNEEEVLTGPQALKIFKPDTLEFYFVSFRKATGFDKTLPQEVTNGAAIHLWNENPFRQTVLIDAA
ncbi:MAG: gametolysin peptidase M11 family, partial [Microgenomates group bacterium Gr01-1014_80]